MICGTLDGFASNFRSCLIICQSCEGFVSNVQYHLAVKEKRFASNTQNHLVIHRTYEGVILYMRNHLEVVGTLDGSVLNIYGTI